MVNMYTLEARELSVYTLCSWSARRRTEQDAATPRMPVVDRYLESFSRFLLAQ